MAPRCSTASLRPTTYAARAKRVRLHDGTHKLEVVDEVFDGDLEAAGARNTSGAIAHRPPQRSSTPRRSPHEPKQLTIILFADPVLPPPGHGPT